MKMAGLREFSRSQAGNVTTFMAIAAVPLMLAVGSAVDYMRFVDAKADLQAALDGAAVSAALPNGLSDSQREKIAKDYFVANFAYPQAEVPVPDVAVSAASVKVSADFRLPTGLMYLAGIKTMEYVGEAEVMRPFAGTAEVALVLDFSGSMNDKNKYRDMQTAAKGMINALDASLPDDKLKMGLVPFSAMVYASINKSYVTQASGTATWTGCTQDRRFPLNTNVNTPNIADNTTKWGYIESSSQNSGSYSCANYASKSLKIVPLTNNMSGLKTKLDAMRPLGYTNIPLGAEFGWNLLDPQEPFSEGAPYSDKLTRKFLVLLTDGLQTTNQWGPGNSRSTSHAEQNLVTLCSNMRAKDITVFTIAYDVTDSKVTTLLSDCAPGRYFEPDAGGTEINQVFQTITSQIKNQTARIMK